MSVGPVMCLKYEIHEASRWFPSSRNVPPIPGTVARHYQRNETVKPSGFLSQHFYAGIIQELLTFCLFVKFNLKLPRFCSLFNNGIYWHAFLMQGRFN